MLKIPDLPRQWQKPLLALLLVSGCSILAFYPTWASMVSIWERSETFAHGYLVVPASLWLIWLRRDDYPNLCPSFSFLALLFVLASGFAWLAADLVSVLVVRQWAAVGILVACIWAVLGNTVAQRMLFPLLFLFLMVPFGEEFIPWLMEYTATFVVAMLRLTGLSVYREGTFFTLSSGQWSVVEGCSGLRYLIASFTLGAVYAYLNYNSYKKRAVFIIAAFLTPIVANGFRAYMIVMIGHLSDMKLATGVDHILYGWVFFGLVMLLLFYVGSFWQDPPTTGKLPPAEYTLAGANDRHLLAGVCITLFCIWIWPIAAANLHAKQAVTAEIPTAFTKDSLGMAIDPPDWGWEPQFKGVKAEHKFYFDDGESPVGMYFANFGDESDGGELVNSQNYLVRQKHPVWRIIRNDKATVTWLENDSVMVDESVLNSEQRDLLVLRWYRLADTNTSSAYYAKWLQLLKRLTGDASPELLVVLYTQTPHGSYDQARTRLIKLAQACCG